MLVAGRDPDAVIGDGQPRIGGDAHLDGISAAELHGIVDQVRDYLLDANPVPLTDDGLVGMYLEIDPDPLRARSLEPFHRLANDASEIDGGEIKPEPAGIDPGDVEQLVDQPLQALDLPLHVVDAAFHPPAFIPGRDPLQQFHLQLEWRERRLQFVRRDGDEFVAAGDGPVESAHVIRPAPAHHQADDGDGDEEGRVDQVRRSGDPQCDGGIVGAGREKDGDRHRMRLGVRHSPNRAS